MSTSHSHHPIHGRECSTELYQAVEGEQKKQEQAQKKQVQKQEQVHQ